MKKFLFGTLLMAFIIGAGTGAFAAGNEDKDIVNFGQMKPHMEEMHPDLSTQELKDMYDTCHGNGANAQAQPQQNMMNNL